MSGTYQRTLSMALMVVGALPLLLLLAVTIMVVRQLGAGGPDATMVILAIGGGLLVATVSLAVGAARTLGAPIQALREGVAVMVEANRGHRLATPGERDLAELARGVNALAERADRADHDVEAQLARATRELAFEKETLASVLFALADGVVVCNQDLRIILSNAAARRMLSRPSRPLRRGETLFAYVDPAMVRPLIEPPAARRDDAPAPQLERGTLALRDGAIVHVSATLAVGEGEERHHVFVLRDVTREVALNRSRDRFLLDTVRRLRAPAAALLSAAEILRDYGELPEPQRRAFLDILRGDAERLADELDAMQSAAGGPGTSWPGEDVPIRELAERAAADLAPALEGRDQRVSTGGDHVAAVGDRLALLQVARRLLELAAARAPAGAELSIRWRRLNEALLELVFEGPEEGAAGGAGDRDEESLELGLGDGGAGLRDVVKDHHGEVWVRRSPGRIAIVVLLPTRADDAPRVAAIGASGDGGGDAVGRQVLALLAEGGFYDPRPAVVATGAAAEGSPTRADARLADLSYVVFDLETTGLGPGRGDEVVSIGAVRVRGGRVIPEDYFFSLVDPGRPIPPASTRIHGITDEMVAGQPRLEAVLPRFVEFVAESVPAAHVASFDLAFLNPRLARMGQPPVAPESVLDTLLLSYSLFPSWGGYNIDEIAARLGLDVRDRHTSLGDALVTAEILIRLLGVLEQRGVTTLGAALRLQGGDVLRKAVGAVRAELNWG
jgi:DNA polymerase-3 subunit epsilon